MTGRREIGGLCPRKISVVHEDFLVSGQVGISRAAFTEVLLLHVGTALDSRSRLRDKLVSRVIRTTTSCRRQRVTYATIPKTACTFRIPPAILDYRLYISIIVCTNHISVQPE